MAGLISTINQQQRDTTGGLINKILGKQSNAVPTFSFAKKSDLKTSAGLYNLAVQSGLQKQADRVLATQTGEETKKIFSGGFISDVFDVLNALQYGVVGLAKGKTFMEGVKTRQSFSDQDALGDKGLPGIIGGIILDIAVDPLTYIAPYTIVKKVPFLQRAIKGTKELLFGKKVSKVIQESQPLQEGVRTYETLRGGTKLGKYLGQKFTWMFGADPIFKETFERGLKNTAISTSNIAELTRGMAKIKPETASKILTKKFFPELKGERFIRTPLKELGKILNPKELEVVSKFYNKIDNLGKEAVDLGLLSKSKFEENIGEYIKNAYEEYELAKRKGIFGYGKLGIKGIKERKIISPEKMEKLGHIDNPTYLLFKSAFDLSKDVENAKLFKQVAEKFGTEIAQDGFTKLPTGIKLGNLAGKYVPDNIASYLNEIITPSTNTIQKQLVANFKFFKVIMNPATHARNIVSNKILNYWKLGMNPLDPRVVKTDLIAIKEVVKGSGKWIDEAKPLGYHIDTFASAEMRGLLDSPEALGFGKKLGGKWAQVKKTLGDIYQNEENYAKISAYIYNRTVKKINPEEAWKLAESATFNYAQVTPFVRKLRESLFGFPFITFTVKATPVALETAYKYPRRISVIGKMKQSIENLSDIKETEAERAAEPPWVKDGFYIKLPIKDKHGRSAYFDMTYILPFGDLLAGNFWERQINRETGLPESQIVAMGKKSPFIQTVSYIAKNQDFYGNKIWRDTDSTEKQLGDLMMFLTKQYFPPPVTDQLPGGYNERGERQYRGIYGAAKTPEEEIEQKRTIMQELLKNAGIKIQPIDADIQENYQEWNQKKALNNLLIESGVLKSFDITYQPK